MIGRLGPSSTQMRCIERAEFCDPAPNGFVGQFETPLGQEVFDVAQTQAVPKIELDGVLDDGRREMMASVQKSSTWRVYSTTCHFARTFL